MARARRLTDEHRTFIVQRLAMFDTPTQVVAAVKATFGLALTPQGVQFYDPTVGEKPGKKWVALFEATRKSFLEEIAGEPAAHKAVRIRRLARAADLLEEKASEAKSPAMAKALLDSAAQKLEQIAKERGDYFTNTRKHSGVVGSLNLNVHELTDEQLAHIAAGGSLATLPR